MSVWTLIAFAWNLVWNYIRSKSVSDTKALIETYRIILEDVRRDRQEYKEQLRHQQQVIESFRARHPDNGEELDAWLLREQELHRMIIACNVEKTKHKEEVIFTKIILAILQKKYDDLKESREPNQHR